MIRKIFLVIGLLGLGSIYLQADYVIQLGLYKDKSLLHKKIDHIDNVELRSNIIIEKRGELYWAHSKTIKDTESMKYELSRYREYFKDAFPKEVSSVKKEKTEVDTAKPMIKDPLPEPKRVINDNTALKKVDKKETPSAKIETVLSDNNARSVNMLPMKKQMKGKVFYICFESKNREIVRVEFDEQYANYSTVVGSRYPFKVFYKVANDRLYTFRDKFSTDSVYLTLEEEQKTYLLMSTWYEGKKVKTMRYYHDLDNAMAHMNRD